MISDMEKENSHFVNLNLPMKVFLNKKNIISCLIQQTNNFLTFNIGEF